MASHLMDGDTDEAEADTIMKLLANASLTQYGQSMSGDKAFLARLGEELDREDIARPDHWSVKYPQRKQTP